MLSGMLCHALRLSLPFGYYVIVIVFSDVTKIQND